MAILARWKWPLCALGGLAAVLIVAATVSKRDDEQDNRRLAQAVANEHKESPGSVQNEAAEKGLLSIWVPAGLVGDDYWVYLDGHIVSAPPRGSEKFFAVLMSTEDDSNHKNGWTISDENGMTLVVRHGYFLKTDAYNNYIAQNLNSASGDAKGLFHLVNLPLHSGKYTVEVAFEVAYFSEKHSYSFPFVFSNAWEANVESGKSLDLHIGIPDDWRNIEPARAASALSCEAKVDVRDLNQQLNVYLADPVAQALKAAQASSPPGSDGSAVLELPAAQGGTREYDKSQIRLMANAVLANYWAIDGRNEHERSEIDDCKNSHPEWSASLDEYAKTARAIENEFQPLRTLAGK